MAIVAIGAAVVVASASRTAPTTPPAQQGEPNEARGDDGAPARDVRVAVTGGAQDADDARARAARRARATVERDMDVFARIVENHDLSPADAYAVSRLLLAERRALSTAIAERSDASTLNARCEDIREATDNAVAGVLSGTQRQAWDLMRQGRGDDVAQARQAADRE